jgi:hypothetical protein
MEGGHAGPPLLSTHPTQHVCDESRPACRTAWWCIPRIVSGLPRKAGRGWRARSARGRLGSRRGLTPSCRSLALTPALPRVAGEPAMRWPVDVLYSLGCRGVAPQGGERMARPLDTYRADSFHSPPPGNCGCTQGAVRRRCIAHVMHITSKLLKVMCNIDGNAVVGATGRSP